VWKQEHVAKTSMKEEELCALTVIRRLWKSINNAKDLEEAKLNFKQTVLKLLLEE